MGRYRQATRERLKRNWGFTKSSRKTYKRRFKVVKKAYGTGKIFTHSIGRLLGFGIRPKSTDI